jgi:Cu+-exporting ATPase
MAVDMVCEMVVDEKSAPAKTTYEGEDYHFCAPYCRDAFDKEPEKFINGAKEWGKTTDPVCGMQIDIADAADMSIHRGRFIYFCNSACKEKFDADPEKYLKSGSNDADRKPM